MLIPIRFPMATVQLNATVRDQWGREMPAHPLTWNSSQPEVASVGSGGLVAAKANGSTTIIAVATPAVSGWATLTVEIATGDADERPVHEVTLTTAFRLQKTEVTQAQWRAVMGSNPSFFGSCGDTCPVERVSWNDIQAFLLALNAVSPGTDPTGPVGGTARVLRGGGVEGTVANARSANRLAASPSSSGFAIYYGFRLAKTP